MPGFLEMEERVVLEEYRRKRDFAKSPEPEGHPGKSPSGFLFVVQKHAASRLHYDFRLELEGVLKSWAVPKGPSLDPAEKHLAVHVEDHPLEYGSFEGIIPQEEYGGGTVMLWDQGWWEPIGDPAAGYAKGNLKFKLHGQKLKGEWALVRMHGRAGEEGKNWLLLKKNDAYATKEGDPREESPRSVASGRNMEEIKNQADAVWTKQGLIKGHLEKDPVRSPSKPDLDRISGAEKSPMPERVKPELAVLGSAPPAGEQWIHEIKYDGYRLLAFLKKGRVLLRTRNGKDWTDKFPMLAQALAELPVQSAVLDGEVVVQKPDGTTDFQSLQNLLKGVGQGMLLLYLFDLLHLDGYDLTRAELLSRKRVLEAILAGLDKDQAPLRYSSHIKGRGAEVYQHACRFALEGIISKQATSRYEHKRSRSWRKTKCIQRQEFVIGGYTNPSGGRTGFGALLLGVFEKGKLLYVGKVGTGFTDQTLSSLVQIMKPLVREQPPFANPPRGGETRKVRWLEPRLVAEVEFTAWTQDGALRHPSFKGIREDKAPEEISRERAVQASRQEPKTHIPPVKKEFHMIAGVKLTHPDRILYPDQGVTKAELAAYYEETADFILPHLKHRPVTLVRCPEGRDKECFYQKHVTDSMPGSIRSIPVKEKDGTRNYIGVTDLNGLISLVQLGALEFHPWGSREDKLERPDLMIFDLDPAPDVAWKRTVQGARSLHGLLNELGLENFVKTSGGKGLHIVVPLTRRSGWDEVKSFAGAVSQMMVTRDPDSYIATMSKSKRKGKIFIDYFRNSRGSTSVAPYSTRAKQGAPVSVPLSWQELSPGIKPDHYTVSNLRRRLSSLQKDPWEGFFKVRQSITKEMKKRAHSS